MNGKRRGKRGKLEIAAEIEQGVKTCTQCNELKPLENYHKRCLGNGYNPVCKDCRKKEWQSPESKKRANLRKYNLTEIEFEAMAASQLYVCAICKKPNEAGRDLAVDHDHTCCNGPKSCGECIRGLLCGNCNKGLGNFRDNPELLEAAILYLGGP